MKTTKFTLLHLSLFFIFSTTIVFGQFRGPMEEPFIPGQLIVQIDKNTDIEGVIKSLPSHYKFKVDRSLYSHMRAWLIEFDVTAISQANALSLLKGEKSFTIVQNNHLVEMRNTVPNDPNYGQQWHHSNTGQNGGTPGADIKSEEAWDITTGGINGNGDDIVVCILEQVDFSHNDLNPNRWTNTAEIPGNGIDDDGNGYVDDIHGWNVAGGGSGNLPTNASGHGTNVAGMIGAVGNNSLGVAGANWNVKMMNVVGYNINSEASVVAAYDYPLTQRKIYNQTNGQAGAFVVATNASWGIDQANPANYPIWCAFYDTLGTHGILNCGATTNSNLNVDAVGDMPTACGSQYMVGVGRSDRNDNFQGGYGATTINFAAPGVNVTTTANGNSYTSTTGTSFASPLTAGVIALMYSIPCPEFTSLAITQPQAAADQVFTALMNGTDPKSSMTNFFITGGRLNAKNAIDLLMNEVCGSCQPPSGIQVNNIGNNTAEIDFTAVSGADDYTLYYQEQGSSIWNNINSTSNNFSLSGLNNCSTYEFYIVATCDTAQSNPTSTFTFNTTGCGNCIELTYCSSEGGIPGLNFEILSPSNIAGTVTNYSETGGWGKDIDDGYIYGNLVLVDDGTTNGDEGCSALVNGAAVNGNIAVVMRGNCNFTDKALNAQNAGAIGVIIVNNVAGNPIVMGGTSTAINIPVVMVTNITGNALINELNNGNNVEVVLGEQNEWIDEFAFNGTTINTGDDNGYRAPDLSPFQVDLGQTYSFELTPSFDGNQTPQQVRIWIDEDQDGNFQANELVYDQAFISGASLTDNLTIPATALTGSTRMRVQMIYNGTQITSLPDGCDSFYSGEVEDYCLQISTGIPCNYNIATNVQQPACSDIQNGQVTLDVSGGTAPYTYNWSNGGSTNEINSNLGAGNISVTVTDATGCDTTMNFTLTYTTNLNVSPQIIQPDCAGNENGEISVTVSGGSGISYLWNNGATTNQINQLAAGTYSVVATSSNGCSITENFNLTYNTNLLLEPVINHPTCDDTNDGSIAVSASGGTGVVFQWTNGPTNAIYSGLTEGTYEVTATASNGCLTTESYVLEANPLTPTASFNSAANGLTASFFNTSANSNNYFWDFGDGTTSTNFNVVHNFPSAGTYNVCLTAFGDCENDEVCQEIVIDDELSTDLNDLENQISVYPNPSNGKINIEFNHVQISDIDIIDAAGRLVKQVKIVTPENTILDLENLENGIYTIKFIDNQNEQVTQKKISLIK